MTLGNRPSNSVIMLPRTPTLLGAQGVSDRVKDYHASHTLTDVGPIEDLAPTTSHVTTTTDNIINDTASSTTSSLQLSCVPTAEHRPCSSVSAGLSCGKAALKPKTLLAPEIGEAFMGYCRRGGNVNEWGAMGTLLKLAEQPAASMASISGLAAADTLKGTCPTPPAVIKRRRRPTSSSPRRRNRRVGSR